MEIKQIKTAWVVWQNSDLTEGRGQIHPLAICEQKATALRLGRGQDVQGSNCRVEPCAIYRIENRWCGPVHIKPPTKRDLDTQQKIDEKDAAIAKAKKLGLTEDDIKALS
jgi:hypothetical protein